VGWALLFYAPWLVTFSTNSILNRAFFALGDTMTPVMISIWGMVVNVLFSVILLRPLGIGGLALGTTLASAGKAVLMLYFLRKKTGPIHGVAIALEHSKILASALLMGMTIILVGSWLPFDVSAGFRERALPVVLRVASGSLVYGGAMLLFRSEIASRIRGRT